MHHSSNLINAPVAGRMRARSILFALSLVAVLPSAHAVVGVGVTLDFSGNICGVSGNTACATNGLQIGQSYGDVIGVLDVSHRSAVAATGATSESFLKYWSTGYSGLTGVAWGGYGPTTHFSEMTFTPGIGQQVTLDGLDFGDYQNLNLGSKVAVYDLSNPGGSPLWDGGTFNPGLTPTHFAPAISSITGLILRWGPDNYNVGIDNIKLTITPVPEPETYAMMLIGLGLLGVVTRRKSKTLNMAAKA